jgi:light-regulated signal transduction histidine kinase (bacteriophytochrome)
VSLSALAREAFQDVVPGESRRGIAFAVGDLPAAPGDAVLLRVVLHQLLANAVKFTASRPERRIEVRAVREEGAVWYEVADSGIGFDPAHVKKLFGLFQRLHAREGFTGTGIGLAIVKRIVERHGGRVRAEGAVGRGATFAFTIPQTGGDDA